MDAKYFKGGSVSGNFGPRLKGKTVEVVEGKHKGLIGVAEKEDFYGWVVGGYIFPWRSLRIIETKGVRCEK
jgi:hypothetical protein